MLYIYIYIIQRIQEMISQLQTCVTFTSPPRSVLSSSYPCSREGWSGSLQHKGYSINENLSIFHKASKLHFPHYMEIGLCYKLD